MEAAAAWKRKPVISDAQSPGPVLVPAAVSSEYRNW